MSLNGPLDGPLDGALAAWAATVRLPDDAAAAAYHRIVATPAPVLTGAPPAPAPAVAAEPATSPTLDPAWWRTFTADFAQRMVISTRPSRQAA